MREGWEIKSLGDSVEFQRGLTYSKKDEVAFSDNVVLRSNNVDLKTNALDFNDLKYINSSIIIPDSKKVLKGSLIICTANGSKSHLGKVALIDEDYGYAFGGFMGLIKPKSFLDSNFLFYYLTSETYKKFIGAVSDGANINNLKFSDLENFDINLPPLPEQQRIVSILDKAFAAIDKAKANAEQNLKNAKELFECLKARYFSFCMLTSEMVNIDFVCDEIFAGGDAPKGNYSKVQTQQYSIPIIANAVKDQGLYGYTDYARVTKPSITIAARGSGTGHVELRSEAFFPIVRLIVLTPAKDKISLEFLKYAIKNLEILSSGSAIPQLTIPMLREYSIPLPSLEEQEGITLKLNLLVDQVTQIDRVYQMKVEGLDDLKKSLLQKAFSGELTEKMVGV